VLTIAIELVLRAVGRRRRGEVEISHWLMV